MSATARRLAVLPGPLLAGPPLILAVALGAGVHRLRTRRAHR